MHHRVLWPGPETLETALGLDVADRRPSGLQRIRRLLRERRSIGFAAEALGIERLDDVSPGNQRHIDAGAEWIRNLRRRRAILEQQAGKGVDRIGSIESCADVLEGFRKGLM